MSRYACYRCGAHLGRDQAATLCSPCQRTEPCGVDAPAVKPLGFWYQPAVADALASRHFGRVLSAYRHEHRPVLTQAQLAAWLGITQVQVSRIERAARPPRDLDKLAAWAETLGIPESQLWFRLSAGQPAETASPPEDVAWFADADPGWMLMGRATPVTAAGIREITQTFRQLDNQFGGGHARDMVHAYLVDDVSPILQNRQLTPATITAVAELNQLAGWMAYDVGENMSGRRHLQRALHLCQYAGDEALSAEMLAGVSHQAAHGRRAGMAIQLAQVARSTAETTSVSALHSETAVMEAHGHALRGDKQNSHAALHDAERTLAQGDAQEKPDWLRYYDTAYLSAKIAHCLRELGELRTASDYARRSLEMTAGYERGRLFNLALLGAILADQGKIDEACEVGRQALHLAHRLHSTRTVTYLSDFARRIRRHHVVPAAADLDEQFHLIGI